MGELLLENVIFAYRFISYIHIVIGYYGSLLFKGWGEKKSISFRLHYKYC